MSNDLLRRIESQLSSMTAAQKKVADYILADSMEASFSTIDKLSHAAGVSTASVIRLANALGYGTFSEFQRDLKDCIRLAAAPIHRLNYNAQEPDEQPQGMISEVYRHGLDNLNSVIQDNEEEEFRITGLRLAGAKNIYVTGARTSESTARYLAFNLNRIYQNTLYIADSISSQIDMIKKAGPDDAVIVITVSRYNRILCETAGKCREKGSFVLGLTDSFDSPLVPVSDTRLIGKCWSADFHNSILSQILIADMLIKSCSEAAPERVRKNLEYDEEIFKNVKYFVR